MQFWTLRGKNRFITILVTNWGHCTVSDYILLCKWVCQYRPIIGNKFKCSATYKQARRKMKTFEGINKGQYILKRNFRAKTSTKKQMSEFVFLSWRRRNTLDSGINVPPGIIVAPPLKNFHITIFILFYINLGFAVIFNFFFSSKFFKNW